MLATSMKKIELRKVSFNTALSEETSAYSAQVWVDGRHFADVSNHGTGGCDMFHPAKGLTHSELQTLNSEIKETYPKRLSETGANYDADLESVCGELLMKHLESHDLKRLLRRTIAFVVPAKKGVLSFKGKHEGVSRAHLVTETLRKYPGAKVLNNLPFDEALALFVENR